MHELLSIPDGRAGLDAKVRKIRALVEQAKRDPWFRARAAAIVRHVPERDQVGEVEAVWQWVREHVRYLRDPWSPDGLEVFTTPRRLLEDASRGVAAEDCDGHVILASALIETIGYPTRYRIGGVSPEHWRHIWLEARTNRGWHPLELTKKDEGFTYDPSRRFPLTLTMDGTNMLDQGLGAAQGGFARTNTSKLSEAYMEEMKRKREQIQRPGGRVDRLRREREKAAGQQMSATAMVERGVLTRYDQFSQREKERIADRAKADARRGAAAARSGRGVAGLGAMPEPTPQEQRWLEEATTDVYTDNQMLGELSGPFSKLRKLRKKTLRKVKRVAKKVRKPLLAAFSPTAGMAMIGKRLRRRKKGRGSAAPEPVETDETMMQAGGAGGIVSMDPASTGLAPPALFDEAQGAADPSTADPFRGWDAQTDEQEVASLYTPAMQGMIAADKEPPAGDYAATPSWPGTEDAYDEAAPSWGMEPNEDDTMNTDDPTDVYGETDTPKGLGDWLSDLATQVVKTGLTYQQAKLQARAAKKGYGELQFGPQPAPVATPLGPSVPQQQGGAPPAARAAMAYGPWILAGVGALVVFALARGSRRSR